MTVKEIIEELMKMPEKASVTIEIGEKDKSLFIKSIQKEGKNWVSIRVEE